MKVTVDIEYNESTPTGEDIALVMTKVTEAVRSGWIDAYSRDITGGAIIQRIGHEGDIIAIYKIDYTK